MQSPPPAVPLIRPLTLPRAPKATPPLTLVSHSLCPYVQRAVIALMQKQVPFQRRTIDLADKPDWFLKISPLGKVPLLQVGDDAVLFESSVILEYLEDTQPRPLHPIDPLHRAEHRAWIEVGSAILQSIGRFYSAREDKAFDAEAERLAELFDRVENALGNGPWFAGSKFSLVDTVYGPIFRYFDTFDKVGEFNILSGKPRLAAWRRALAGHAAVSQAVAPDYATELQNFILRREGVLAGLLNSRLS